MANLNFSERALQLAAEEKSQTAIAAAVRVPRLCEPCESLENPAMTHGSQGRGTRPPLAE